MKLTLGLLITFAFVYGFAYLLTRHSKTTKWFTEKSPDKQEQINRQYKSILRGIPLTLPLLFLLNSLPNLGRVLGWLTVALYLTLALVAGYFFWRAYKLGIRRSVELVKTRNKKPVPNPEAFLTPLALFNLAQGVNNWVQTKSIPRPQSVNGHTRNSSHSQETSRSGYANVAPWRQTGQASSYYISHHKNRCQFEHQIPIV